MQLKPPTLVPQPGVGVSDAAQMQGGWIRSSLVDQLLDLLHHGGNVSGWAQPGQSAHLTLGTNVDIEHTNGLQQGGHGAAEQLGCVLRIHVLRSMLAVLFGGTGRGGVSG